MKLFHRLSTGIVAAVAGIAIAVPIGLALTMNGFSLEMAPWMMAAFGTAGLIAGLVFDRLETGIVAAVAGTAIALPIGLVLGMNGFSLEMTLWMTAAFGTAGLILGLLFGGKRSG